MGANSKPNKISSLNLSEKKLQKIGFLKNKIGPRRFFNWLKIVSHVFLYQKMRGNNNRYELLIFWSSSTVPNFTLCYPSEFSEKYWKSAFQIT